jgi:hypothetical protein
VGIGARGAQWSRIGTQCPKVFKDVQESLKDPKGVRGSLKVFKGI